jgi:hypothetical protein
MDGEVLGFDSELNLGDIIGEDKRRYGFAIADWHAAAPPERGDGVRFVAAEDRATQIYLLRPAHAPPLTPSEAISAVYTTAFGRAGDPDLFGAATIRKRDYVLPVLIMLVFGEIQLLLHPDLPVDWHELPFWIGLLLLAFLAIGLSVMLAIATAVVALLGRLTGERGRVRCGVLAFLWVEAVVVQPAVCILRLILGPRDPGIVLALLAIGLIAAIVGAGRVVKSGFQLSNAAVGVFIVVVAGLVDFVLDRLIA